MTYIQPKPRPPRLLPPLREIGRPDDTQSWDLDDIQAAIREAYFKGIPVESLFFGKGRAAEAHPRPMKTAGQISTPAPSSAN